ncbi:hypothetical protein EV421DRAFT_1740745 [Armillaria borealis]|uniref:Uncharacterized protein n=1 Tax=Armillaria borealis TaxID=47425 RepID=A0AA39J248_9AGAR|nr:hypothetical protein EV421DRAFT_1740745 [Armillaria borealis]
MYEQAQDDKAKTEGTRLEYTKESVTYRAMDVWGAQSFTHVPINGGHRVGFSFSCEDKGLMFWSRKFPKRIPSLSSPAPTTNFDKCHLPDDKEHPDSVISFIQSCDTTFFGTTSADDEIRSPSHVGMNVCGGRPGFIHIQPSDKRTLILPDFSGNGIMTSLGNVETMLSLSRVSFATDIYSYEMLRLVQQCPGTMVQRSPYSLPNQRLSFGSATHPEQQLLKSIAFHSSTIATFTWESSLELNIISSQAVVQGANTCRGVTQCLSMTTVFASGRMYGKRSTAARERKSLPLYEPFQTIDPVMIVPEVQLWKSKLVVRAKTDIDTDEFDAQNFGPTYGGGFSAGGSSSFNGNDIVAQSVTTDQNMTDVFSLCHHVDIDSYDALYARFEGWAVVWPWQAPIFWMCAFVNHLTLEHALKSQETSSYFTFFSSRPTDFFTNGCSTFKVVSSVEGVSLVVDLYGRMIASEKDLGKERSVGRRRDRELIKTSSRGISTLRIIVYTPFDAYDDGNRRARHQQTHSVANHPHFASFYGYVRHMTQSRTVSLIAKLETYPTPPAWNRRLNII